MTRFQLPPHLFVCIVDGKHVFLDLVRDRYFRLPEADDGTFAALAAGGVDGMDDQGLAPLIRAGILVPYEQGKPIAVTSHPPPTTSLAESAAPRPRAKLLDVAEIAILVGASRRTVRRKALPKALANLSGQRRDRRQDPAERNRLVRRFVAARHFVPIAPNCLYDSLALRQYLARRQVGAELVIGVKLHPFGAHCWLQDDVCVLNDAVGGACGFQPVLVS